MTYTAKEIARYIVKWFNEQERQITNMKLQKLLYFAWIEYYKQTGQELFSDPFNAWQYGPVVRDEYYRYACYGGDSIPYVTLSPSDEPAIDNKTIKILVNNVLKPYQNTSAFDLAIKSHASGGAWEKIQEEIGLYKEIPFSLIKKSLK